MEKGGFSALIKREKRPSQSAITRPSGVFSNISGLSASSRNIGHRRFGVQPLMYPSSSAFHVIP